MRMLQTTQILMDIVNVCFQFSTSKFQLDSFSSIIRTGLSHIVCKVNLQLEHKEKRTNLELRRKIVLYEPEFHRAVCVLQHTQHHNFQKSLIPVLAFKVHLLGQ